MDGDPDVTQRLVRQAGEGDREALDELFERHRERLLRMVQIRLDPRLRGRVDASDVIQEAHLEAFRRIDEYLADREFPFFLWLRFLTSQKILELQRRHLGAQKRDVRHEVRLHRGPLPGSTTQSIANQLLGKHTTPSEAAIRAEMRLRLEAALDNLDPVDREVLSLRHFEQLSNAEAAQELGMEQSATSKRYVRALGKLKEILATMPGGTEE